MCSLSKFVESRRHAGKTIMLQSGRPFIDENLETTVSLSLARPQLPTSTHAGSLLFKSEEVRPIRTKEVPAASSQKNNNDH